MITRRMDNGGFEIVRSLPQVLITGNGRTLVAGTMQLLTDGSDRFEEPLISRAIEGMGWAGRIVEAPETSLPGMVDPFVWIEPADVPQSVRDVCLEVVLDGGAPQFHRPAGLSVLWRAGGAAAGHSYSLRPTTMRIASCFAATFTDPTMGAQPARENEGNLATLNGQDAIVVDVDMDNFQGFAVTLDSAIASAKRVLGI